MVVKLRGQRSWKESCGTEHCNPNGIFLAASPDLSSRLLAAGQVVALANEGNTRWKSKREATRRVNEIKEGEGSGRVDPPPGQARVVKHLSYPTRVWTVFVEKTSASKLPDRAAICPRAGFRKSDGRTLRLVRAEGLPSLTTGRRRTTEIEQG